MVDILIVLGYIATTLGIIQHIPQISLIYKVKHTDELSLVTLILRLLSAGLTSAYIDAVVQESGFEIALPMIISNVSSWITTLILLYFKLYLFNEKSHMITEF